jgi:hypothetical protein
MVEWISAAGYPLKRVPYPEWREQVLDEVADNPDHPLYPLLPYSVDEEIARMPLAFPCDTSNTLTALEGSGIVCPRIELGVLQKCLSFLVSVGFLSPPPQQSRPEQAEAVTVEVFARWVHDTLSAPVARAGGETLTVRVWESPVAFGGFAGPVAQDKAASSP